MSDPTIIDLDALSAETPATTATTPIMIDEAPKRAAIVNEDDTLDELPAGAVRNDDGTISLTLFAPIDVIYRSSRGGDRTETYAELIFGRLNGADIRAVQAASPAAQGVVLLARSTKIREGVMNALWDRMDGSDIAAAQDIVKLFLETGPKTRRRT